MPGFYWVFQLQGDKETLNVTNMTTAPSGMWTILKDENGQSYPFPGQRGNGFSFNWNDESHLHMYPVFKLSRIF